MINANRIKLAATLSAEINPLSPVIMGGDAEKLMPKASQLGYEAVELHWSDPADIPLDLIYRKCQELEMTVSAFATGRAYVQDGLNLIDDDIGIQNAAVKRVKEFVNAAAPFRSTVIIGCIRGNLKDHSQREASLDELARVTREIAGYASDNGVNIVFEAINRYENNYLNTAHEAIDFIKHYELANTKVLLDTFHMNIEDPDPVRSIIDCNELLGYFHVADSNRMYAGAGHIPLDKIMDAIKLIGYRGYISAECLPLPDSDTALRNWIKGLKEHLE